MRMIALAAFAASIAFAPAATQAQATADDPLVGLWASETVFTPHLQGALTVTREGANWRATIGGSTAAATDGEGLRFDFGARNGQFRGTLSRDAPTIDGFWLQPPGGTGDPNDPGGSSQSFASRVVLQRTAHDTWSGVVRPLQNTFTLYLRIFAGPNGLIGAFRNPERNAVGSAYQYRVAREGDTVRFTAGADPAKPETTLTATLVRSPDRLRIRWPEISRTVELERREPAQVASYFPRPPGEPRYVYRAPPAIGDGWRTARARDVGMNETPLRALIQRLIDADPAARSPSLIHSLLVAYRGRLVLEEYFFGYDRNTPHDTRSAAKTFSSVLLGAAMRRGVPISPQTRLYPLMAGMGPFANSDPRKANITLAHAMTHTTGLDCDDNNPDSAGEEDRMQTQTAEPNWWKYILSTPQVHDPGSVAAYCSGGMNLMAGALTVATRTSLPEYFDRTVAQPLQMGPYYWNLIPTGEGYLGGGVFMRPRDLLKVGQTYLAGGVWQGRRIVRAAWVKESTRPHPEISPATETPDAYAWHPGAVTVNGRRVPVYNANGNGGQILLVIPEYEMTVVFTGGNYMDYGVWGRWSDQIVGGEIIPAIRG